jgi:hypothetical protein
MCLCKNIHKDMQTYKGIHHCMIYDLCMFVSRERAHARASSSGRASAREIEGRRVSWRECAREKERDQKRARARKRENRLTYNDMTCQQTLMFMIKSVRTSPVKGLGLKVKG